MIIKAVPISCIFCGQTNVKPKTQIIEKEGKKVEKLKWVCPNCGKLIKQNEQTK